MVEHDTRDWQRVNAEVIYYDVRLMAGFNVLVCIYALIERHKPKDQRGRYWSGDD